MNNNVKHNEPLIGDLKNNVLNFDEYLIKMREYAQGKHVPIIKDDGLVFLSQLIKIKNAKEILEIGTAIGYSSICMARLNSHITTIERDPDMYNIAIENINNTNNQNNIDVIFGDALEQFDKIRDKRFDLIFIDAAKGQYKKFFEIYTPLLNKGGIVVCDNMTFHNLVESDTTEMSRSLRGLVNKLRLFTDYLVNNPDFETSIYNIGDGVSVSIKK